MGKETEGISRRNFLSGAAVIGAVSALGIAGCSAPAKSQREAKDVEYFTGSAQGRAGEIIVKAGVADKEIVSIDILKQHETPLIANTALSRIPQLIVANQSLDVDAVSGATITSFGVKDAVADALSKAGISSSDLANSGKSTGIIVEEPIEADIAVIGGGLAGLSTAARLLQNGQKVVLFEETAHVGGSSCVSDGWITGGGTLIEQEAGVEDSAQQFGDYMLKANPPYPEIVRAYADKAGEVFDWLDTYVNVDFGDRTGTYGLYVKPDVPRIYGVNRGGDGLGYKLLELIQDGVEAGNASVILEARVTKLETDGSGAISGVEVTHGDGTVKEYPFKAVIMCTGGYCHNQDMLLANNFKNVGSCAPSTSSGHGFEIAQEVGAQTVLMNQAATYAGGIPNAGFEMRYQINLKFPGIVSVSNAGTRMYNEDVPLLAKAAWSKAPENIGFGIFSEAQRKQGSRPIVLTSYLEGEVTPTQSWQLLDDLVDEGNVAFKADTVEELAKKAGIDVAGLAQTLENCASYVESGADPEFGRKTLQKFEAPYYAIKGVPYLLQTSGGLRISVNAEALDEKEQPIAGLYVAGEQAGFGQWSAGGHGGTGLGGAATWGYIAADSATEYVK